MPETFLDTFTAANGTALNTHNPDIGGITWIQSSGTWEIQSNAAVVVADVVDGLALNDPGMTDFHFRAKVTLHPTLISEFGFYFRFGSFIAFDRLRFSFNPAGSFMTVRYANKNVTESGFAEIDVPMVAGQTFTLNVFIKDQKISVVIDGSSFTYYMPNLWTGTFLGLLNFSGLVACDA